VGAGETFGAKARAFWTDARLHKVTGGKKYLLTPTKAPELLRALGLLNADASMSVDCARKFSQINHMLLQIKPLLDDLAARHARVRVLDVGCGNSYLTFLIAWYLKEHLQHSAHIVGVDRNPRVIGSSRERAALLGFGDVLRFHCETAGSITWKDVYSGLFVDEVAAVPSQTVEDNKSLRPHLVVALHACDTATDEALALGISLEADAMAVAPCCHAELARFWEGRGGGTHPMSPVFSAPNLRREAGAVMTDALRMLLVRRSGYEVTPTEFVPSDHTPKNRLLVCIRRGRYFAPAAAQYQALSEALDSPTLALERLLPGHD
jgi:SAM-dependent methyltransferase